MENDNKSLVVNICEKIIIWGLYIFAFFLPLFFLPFNANSLEMNKQMALVVFSLVFLIAWLGKVIILGKTDFKKSFLNIGIILFSIFSLASSLLSKNIYQALAGVGGTVSESFFSLLGFVIIFFVIVNNIKKREEVLNFILAFILSGFFVGAFGILQLAGKFFLPWDFVKDFGFNTIGSVNSMEIFLAGLLVLSVSLFAESEGARWRRIFYGIASVLFLLAMLSINFVNVWWALLAVMIIIIALGIINREQVSQYRLILPMVVLAFSMLMLLTRMNAFTKWFNMPTEVSPSWNASVDIGRESLKNNLFFGNGPGSYSYVYGLYRTTEVNQTSFWNARFNQGFSRILTLPASLGVAGSAIWLLLILGFAVYGFISLIKRRGKNWVLALSLYSAWFLLAFLQFIYSTNLLLELSFWMILGLAFLTIKTLAVKNDSSEVVADEFLNIGAMSVEFNRNSPMASILSFVFVVVIVLAISALYIGGSYFYADVLYKKGMKAVGESNNLENGSDIISKAVILNPYNDLYLRSLSQAALLRVNQEFAKPQSVERDSRIQNLIAAAINIAKRSTDLASLNVDNWAQRGTLYQSIMPYAAGADQWAFDAFNEATKLEPQNPYYYYELGRSYGMASELLAANAGEDKEKQVKAVDYLAKAEESLTKAVSLKSDYAIALYQLSVVYDKEGQIDKAIVKMKDAQTLYPQDVGVAFQLGLLYYKQNSLLIAREQFERAIMIDQNYSNARYFLGLIYDKQGEKNKAIQQFEKIKELNPGNSDVEKILGNLKSGKPAISQFSEGLPIR